MYPYDPSLPSKPCKLGAGQPFKLHCSPLQRVRKAWMAENLRCGRFSNITRGSITAADVGEVDLCTGSLLHIHSIDFNGLASCSPPWFQIFSVYLFDIVRLFVFLCRFGPSIAGGTGKSEQSDAPRIWKKVGLV